MRLLGAPCIAMITALVCRGPDSTGVAMYRSEQPTGSWIARVKLGDSGDLAARAEQISQAAAAVGAEDFSRIDAYLRFSG